VIDGSVVARSLGVNPLLTITALSERAMLHFAADHGLRFDDAPVTGAPLSVYAPGAAAA
jgi:cholesterol oxidase